MFVTKQFLFYVPAFFTVQVLSAHGTPMDTGPTLERRWLLNAVTNPVGTLSNGIATVDNGLRQARSAGRNAVLGTVGKGLELTTGVNPAKILDLPKNAAKTAIHGARRGTEVTADTANGALDTVLDIHDRKKQLLEDYVIPVAPSLVGDAINHVNDRFDSTVEGMQDTIQNGREHVVGKLNSMEDWLDHGSSLVPNAVTNSVTAVGNVGQSVTKSAGDWIGSWIPGWSTPTNTGGQGGQSGQGRRGGQSGQSAQAGQVGQTGQAVQAATARTGLSRFLPW